MVKKISKHKYTVGAITVICILFAGFYAWHIRFSKDSTVKEPVKISDSQGHTITADPNVPGGNTGSDVGKTVTLVKPFGNFVSNHAVDLDPNNDRNQEESTCSTTYGANCQLTFTLNDKSVKLPTRKASTNHNEQVASTSWPTWSPVSLGLTPGKWKVLATAELNGQTKTTEDLLTVTQ